MKKLIIIGMLLIGIQLPQAGSAQTYPEKDKNELSAENKRLQEELSKMREELMVIREEFKESERKKIDSLVFSLKNRALLITKDSLKRQLSLIDTPEPPSKPMTPEEMAKFELEMEAFGKEMERMSREMESAFGKDFEAKMEKAFGEDFEARMEKAFGEDFQEKMSALAEEMEELAEEMEDVAEEEEENVTKLEQLEKKLSGLSPEGSIFPDTDHQGEQKKGKKKKRYKPNNKFIALDVGMNTLLYDRSPNLPDEISHLETTPLKSLHWGLHFLPREVNLIKHRLNLLTALDLDINSYGFQEDFHFEPGLDSLNVVWDTEDYKKNKFTTTYIQIPLLLSYQTRPYKKRRNFRFSAGVYGGYLLGAAFKQKGKEAGKRKFSDDFNLNRLRYGVTARVGYGKFAVYTNYTMSSLFKPDTYPELTPVTFGISLGGM